jgi:hypothetical protein
MGQWGCDVVTSEYRGRSFAVYENAGAGTLVNPSVLPAGKAGSCAILHDRDLDGTPPQRLLRRPGFH